MIDTQITARDLMKTQVQTLYADAPIPEAVGSLEDFGITGAPVVDSSERLVGVLTVSDVARSGHVRQGGIAAQRDYYVEDELDRDTFQPEQLDGERVGDWMTPRVVSVAPTASLKDVCTTMDRESVHRVMVVHQSKLLGILSSMDVVRYVAKNGA